MKCMNYDGFKKVFMDLATIYESQRYGCLHSPQLV
jgi:hypothetical protein